MTAILDGLAWGFAAGTGFVGGLVASVVGVAALGLAIKRAVKL